MSQAEARQFFAVIKGRRNQLLFSIIYLYGLRVSETALLSVADVDLDRQRILIRRVKNGAWSERPLFNGILSLLEVYLLNLDDKSPEAPLFPGRKGPLKKRRIQSLFSRYREDSGIGESYTCHSLRHSIATHLLDAGCQLQFVQDHLGHRSIQSTTIYARITNRHREAVFQKLDASPWIVSPAEALHRGQNSEEDGACVEQ